MKFWKVMTWVALFAGLGAAITAFDAQAQSYPEKGRPISLIVPYPAGGPTDVGSRLLASALEKELGTAVQVINKPGGATQIGITELAKSRPDGYTIAMVGVAGTAISYIDEERKASYQRKDLQPVALFMSDSNLMVIPTAGKLKTMKDIIDAAKARPGQVKLGCSGLMSASHFSALMLEEATGVKFAIVQFNGAAPLATAILAGDVDAAITGVLATLPHKKAGTMDVIGTFDGRQSPFFPGVKPVTEQGYNVSLPVNFGVIAPGSTPKAVVDTLSNAIGKVMQGGEFSKKLEEVALTPNYKNTKDFEAFWVEAEAQARESLKLARRQN